MKIGAVAGIFLILMALGCAVIAADSPKAALEAQDMPIEQAMADIGKQCGVQIVLDTGVKGAVTGHFASIELESLLDAITKSNNLKWQKFYLPAKEEQKPTLEQIKARANAVAALAGGAIVVCDPATGKQKVFVEQNTATPSVEPDKIGMKPLYLISKPKVETKDSAETQKANQDAATRFKSLQDERMKLLSQMTPEQRIAAMQQETLAMMYLDPAARQQMMLDQMKARQSMDPQTREQYQQMMHDTFRAMREQGLIPEGQRGGRGRGGGGGPGGPQD